MTQLQHSNLHYVIDGYGPKIMFIHGWAHSSKIWDKIIGEISKKYCCIRIDLPGFGQSRTINKKKISMSDYVNEVKLFINLNSYKDDLYAIISDSLGAIISLKLIEERYISPKRVFLSGCPVNGLPLIFRYLHRLGLIYLLLSLMKLIPEKYVHSFIRLGFKFTTNNTSSINEDVIGDVYDLDVKSANSLLIELAEPVKLDYINLIKHPINFCVVRGESDFIISKKESQKLAKLLEAKYFEIKNSGHTPMQENSNAYLEILEKFLM